MVLLFLGISSFGDGINEKGLMASNNFFPGQASFAPAAVEGMINTTTPNAFDFLLTRSRDVEEVRRLAKDIVLVDRTGQEDSASNHFFFMDAKGAKLVLKPREGRLLAYDNPYGVLTNAPDFPGHLTNMRNYLNLKAENTKETSFNQHRVLPLGEGTGMLGLPGDFTPPSRFVRAAYYFSNTDKDLDRRAAILQGFRILGQFDIPEGAVTDPVEEHRHQTLYRSVMDTAQGSYHIKHHYNSDLQSFYLADFEHEKDLKFLEITKSMDF